MQNNINFVRAKYSTTELFEAIVCLQCGGKYPDIHREAIDQHFTDLARELGYQIERTETAEDFDSEIPALTTAPRPDMSRKSRAEAVS